MTIRYIKYEDIDRQKYNSCVHYALNGRAWGYKWYLEATARRFDVLVEGEYESVMPLVWDTTWSGRKRLISPVFTPGLGVFSVHVLSQKRMGYFLREVDARFDVIDVQFTGKPSRNTTEVDWEWKPDYNQVINIASRDYEAVASNYQSDLLRNLELSHNADLLVHGNQKPEKVAAFMVKHFPNGERLQHPMLRVLYNALHRGWGWSTAVTDREGNWLASNVFVFTHGRVCSLAPCESPEGRELGALNLLYDYAIRQAAGRPIILDFASKDEGRLAGFGASSERNWQANKSTKLLGLLPV
jgi:hypothetical protein